jgi:hypothetical protein
MSDLGYQHLDRGTPADALAQRTRFVRAYVEYAGPVPASERRTVRLPTLLTVTALSVVAALIAGIFAQLIHPAPNQPKDPVAAAAPAGAVAYTAVAGWDCANADDHGFEADGQSSDWSTVTDGGWSRDGCRGTYETMPTVAKLDRDQQGQRAVWWFTPGPSVSRCALEVLVPSTTAKNAATARYQVLSGRAGTMFAEFTVDPASRTGQWVTTGTFPPHNGAIAVELGRQVASGSAGLTLISQVRAVCLR